MKNTGHIFILCHLAKVTNGCVGKIVTLLQAFGLCVCLWGLSNVLQCGLGFFLTFPGGKKKTK